MVAVFVLLASAVSLVLAVPASTSRVHSRLPTTIEVQQHLSNGSDILGSYSDVHGRQARWMENYADSTPLDRMNLPGVHDASTWNYTQSTQDWYYTYAPAVLGLNSSSIGTLQPAAIFQCQNRSLFRMLGDGIRVFDMRIGALPDGRIALWHGPALMSPSATLEDVFFGFYKFLDDYPSETLLVSIKVDNTTFQSSDREVEETVYNMMTTGIGAQFWVQTNATLGTLGDARGKLNLLRRLDWSSLTPASDFPQIGIALPPAAWNDNDPNFSIAYNSETGQRAWIEDYYEIGGPPGVESKVSGKFNATVAHLEMAASNTTLQSELFITFASAEQDNDTPPETPKIVALGNGTVTGVNYRLHALFKQWRARRLGIVMFDWYDPALIEALLSA